MTTSEDILEHYGVKGMKWGVRKDRGHEGQRVKTKKLPKLDQKFQKKAYSRDTAIRLWNSAAASANNDLPGINARWAGRDLSRPGADQDRYHQEVLENFNQHLERAASSLGTNPSGTQRIVATSDGRGIRIVMQDIQHADLELVANFVFDDSGYIIRLEVPSEMKQSATDDILEHYGVKGMKWGVRKKRDPGRTVFEKPPSRLTDDELKRRIQRLESEKRYNELNRRDVSQGERLAAEILTNVGRATVTTVGTAAALYGVSRLLQSQGVDPQLARQLTRRGK